MEWAVRLEQTVGREGVLVLLTNRADADAIAQELRQKGHRVVVNAQATDSDGPGNGLSRLNPVVSSPA